MSNSIKKINSSFLASPKDGPIPLFTKVQAVLGCTYIPNGLSDFGRYVVRPTLVDANLDQAPYLNNLRGNLFLPRGWRFVPDSLSANFQNSATLYFPYGWTYVSSV